MKCEIVQDLIPLVIDGATSDESTEAVRKHIADCQQCQKAYYDMKSELAAKQDQENNAADFVKMAKQMKRRRIRKRFLCLVLCLIIGAGLFIGGGWAWTKLRWEYTQPVSTNEYNVFLSELTDGSVTVSANYSEWMVIECSWKREIPMTEQEEKKKGNYKLYITAMQAVWPETNHNGNQNGLVTILSPEDLTEITEIRMGTERDYKTIWQHGQEIVPASSELEEWVRIDTQIWAIEDQMSENNIALRYEQQEKMAQLFHQQMELTQQVPEWNQPGNAVQ